MMDLEGLLSKKIIIETLIICKKSTVNFAKSTVFKLKTSESTANCKPTPIAANLLPCYDITSYQSVPLSHDQD